MIWTTLEVKTFVLPDPAPATIKQGPSRSIIASFKGYGSKKFTKYINFRKPDFTKIKKYFDFRRFNISKIKRINFIFNHIKFKKN